MGRLTKEEREVIQRAFNLAHSVVPGDYKLPSPMCLAINGLQDAVHDLAKCRGTTVEEGCSQDYLGFNSDYGRKAKMHRDEMTPIQALREIQSLCDPTDARFRPIKAICDNVLNRSGNSGLKNSENVKTVEDMMEALGKMPPNARVCGSVFNDHDEYDCEVEPFWVSHYNDGTDDGLVYVGVDYKHPN